MQAFHLASLLAEHDDDEPLVLTTAELTAHRKPGERTHRRIRLGDPGQIVRALAALQPRPRRSEGGPAPQDILARLQARAHRTPASRERMRAIEAAIAAQEPPTSGPLADPELWAIERALSEGDPRSVAEQLDAFEQRRGRLPATTYLRARAALLTGSEAPRAIAERMSALSASMPDFHELELLAAQAWAAAAEPKRATAFAKDVVSNRLRPTRSGCERRTSCEPGVSPGAARARRLPHAPRAL